MDSPKLVAKKLLAGRFRFFHNERTLRLLAPAG